MASLVQRSFDYSPILQSRESESINNSPISCARCPNNRLPANPPGDNYAWIAKARAECFAALAASGAMLGSITVILFQDGSLAFTSTGCLHGDEALTKLAERIDRVNQTRA